LLERPLDRAQADDGQGARGATDDGVEFAQPPRQIGQRHDLSAKASGELFTALERAVGDHHGLGVFGSKVGDGQVDHFTGAHKQHPDAAQVLEDLRGQPHRRCRHADAVGAHFGAGAHLLGHRKGALKQLVQRGAHGAGLVGRAHRVFHLTENLWLAQNHGIEPAGHSEGVAGGIAVVQGVGVLAQRLAGHAAAGRQPLQRAVDLGAFAGAVNFGAVAGRQQGRLGLAAQGRTQPLQRGRDLVDGKRKPAAQVQRCRVMVQPEGPNWHGVIINLARL
jgi:hypothetical protein